MNCENLLPKHGESWLENIEKRMKDGKLTVTTTGLKIRKPTAAFATGNSTRFKRKL